jgi:hypothetical protein
MLDSQILVNLSKKNEVRLFVSFSQFIQMYLVLQDF